MALVASRGPAHTERTFFAELIAFILMILILGEMGVPAHHQGGHRARGEDRSGPSAAAESEERLAKVQVQVEQTLEEARTQAREILNRAHHEATADTAEVLAKARGDAEARRACTHRDRRGA